MQPTTPTASRTISEFPTVSLNEKSRAICAKDRSTMVGRPAWIAPASLMGMPTSAAMVFASSS